MEDLVMPMKEFVTAWKNDTTQTLHREFTSNPDQVLKRYGITGTEYSELLSAAKTGGQAIEQRINAFMAGKPLAGKPMGGKQQPLDRNK